jgi:peptidoglycan/LPS O-acetylase OafA/YrhL
MPRAVATLLSGAVALGLCLLLSVLSYRFIEGPALNIKKSLRYGADRRSLASGEAGATVVAHTGS